MKGSARRGHTTFPLREQIVDGHSESAKTSKNVHCVLSPIASSRCGRAHVQEAINGFDNERRSVLVYTMCMYVGR